jgi:threonine/homoserine/homoserine lactone efflux protein
MAPYHLWDIMTPEQAVAFLLFAVAAAGTPGPSNLLLTATGAQVGVLRGLPCLLGVTVGMGVMMFLVAFGLGRVVLASPTALRALNWIGAAFLLWLAWKIATTGRRDAAAGRKPVGFIGAAAFQWVNPKSWLVCASAAGAYLTAGSGSALAQASAFGALFVLASLPCCFVWLAFGATAQRFLRTERARRTFNVAMAVLLAGSVVLIAR